MVYRCSVVSKLPLSAAALYDLFIVLLLEQSDVNLPHIYIYMLACMFFYKVQYITPAYLPAD